MKPCMPIGGFLITLRLKAALPDERAEATPPRVYTSPEFPDLELDEIINLE